jgi:hypothetical protein
VRVTGPSIVGLSLLLNPLPCSLSTPCNWR